MANREQENFQNSQANNGLAGQIYQSNSGIDNHCPDEFFDDDFDNVDFDLYFLDNCIEVSDNDDFFADHFRESSPPLFILQSPNDETRSFEVNVTANKPKIVKKRKSKTIIPLNPHGKRYKKNYYRLLNHDNRKTSRKELILKYHNMARIKNNKIRKVLREEYRNIHNYFNNFADQEALILQAIRELMAEGAINYEVDYCTITQY